MDHRLRKEQSCSILQLPAGGGGDKVWFFPHLSPGHTGAHRGPGAVVHTARSPTARWRSAGSTTGSAPGSANPRRPTGCPAAGRSVILEKDMDTKTDVQKIREGEGGGVTTTTITTARRNRTTPGWTVVSYTDRKTVAAAGVSN